MLYTSKTRSHRIHFGVVLSRIIIRPDIWIQLPIRIGIRLSFWINYYTVWDSNNNNNNNNNNAICIAQIRRKQQMGCGQCPKRKAFSLHCTVVSLLQWNVAHDILMVYSYLLNAYKLVTTDHWQKVTGCLLCFANDFSRPSRSFRLFLSENRPKSLCISKILHSLMMDGWMEDIIYKITTIGLHVSILSLSVVKFDGKDCGMMLSATCQR